MSQDDETPTPLDDVLDRLVRNEVVDPVAFVAQHPELSAEERALLFRLCGRDPDGDGAAASRASPRTADTPPVDRIGGIRLGKLIGAGGMGAVFHAWDETLGREIAVKVLGPDLVGSGERAERFLREVRAVARLRHPNIVAVYSAGEHEGLRYMAMELVPGSSLHDVTAAATAQGRRIPVAEVIRIGSQIARALHAAHEAGIVHRDVKPSNIRIATDGRPVLLDFGLAREAGAMDLTESGAFRGSPQYASPEQIGLKGAPIDHRTDVFSLGGTLYESLAGVAPFRGGTREQLFHAILLRDPTPPRKLAPEVPRDLETVVLAALEKDPARRYRTAAALADDLERIRDGLPVSVRPLSPLGRLARWGRRQPAKAALSAALVVAVPLVVVLGAFIARNLSKIDEATQAAQARDLAKVLENAFFEFGEGDPARAQPMFEEALRVDPASALGRAGVVLSLLWRRQHGTALAFLDGPAAANRDAAWHAHLRQLATGRGAPGDLASSRAGPASRPLDAVDHFVLGMIELDRVHSGEKDAASPALAHFQKAVMLSPVASPLYHYELGHAAWHLAAKKEAIDAADAIESLWPESPERNFAVGRMLLIADQTRGLDRLEKAAWNPPRALAARQFLVTWISQINFREDLMLRLLAIAEESARENPTVASCHVVVGVARLKLRRWEAGAAALREAIRLDGSHLNAHCLLGHALTKLNDHEGALAAGEAAVHLAPRDPQALTVVGIALTNLDRPEDAVKPLEAALNASPDDAPALCNLGKAVMMQGDFERALSILERGHALGSKLPGWVLPSEQWVGATRVLLGLEKRLLELRQGTAELPPDERASIAREVCRRKKNFAEAALLYAAAFDDEPALLAHANPDLAMEASACALAAGLGQGADSPADPAARQALRERARAWLAAELESATAVIRSDSPSAAGARARLKAWGGDRVLKGARSGETLAAASPAEAEAWRKLWDLWGSLVAER
jgi:tetratricopeptide (TPR) repeat protein